MLRKKLAERVGFFDRDFANPNVYSGFRLISRNRSDLASSNLRRRFRKFAGVCRFFYFNDTRNGTRRETLGKWFALTLSLRVSTWPKPVAVTPPAGTAARATGLFEARHSDTVRFSESFDVAPAHMLEAA